MKYLWLVAVLLVSTIRVAAEQECKRRPDLVVAEYGSSKMLKK